MRARFSVGRTRHRVRDRLQDDRAWSRLISSPPQWPVLPFTVTIGVGWQIAGNGESLQATGVVTTVVW